MIVLGLTGSVGMGKSTAAKMFAEEGIPVFDADAEVHRLYESKTAPLIGAAFPGVTNEGRIDRERLSARVVGDQAALKKLESIVHPLVREARREFLAKARASGAKVALVDIPLLFETAGDEGIDKIVVVSAPEDVQRARVLARPGMSEDKFQAILARQMPDAQKRKRADFVIDTSKGFEAARDNVRAILHELLKAE
ncbi:MAG TPA: dephospho-CoA kinase [Xanthobacteraceae bacterium]|nr:dephospho-CoA kinase [Xanthobacteraceae bacterium]